MIRSRHGPPWKGCAGLPGLATLAILGACGGTEPNRSPTSLTLALGGNQTAEVGTLLSVAITVRVGDGQGGLGGVPVAFAVATGAGSVSPATDTSDASGSASTQWTLGPTAGAQSITATVTGVAPLTVPATALAGPPASVVDVSGNGQFAVVNRAVPLPLVARVTDQFGNAVQGVPVSFFVTSGGGTVTGASQVSDASGNVTLGGWILGPLPGQQRVMAATNSGFGREFLAFGTPASIIAVAGIQQSSNAGTLVSIPPSARALDGDGNPLPGTTVTFSVKAGGGRVSGGTRTTDAAGLATVVSWVLGAVPGENRLAAETPGLTTAALFTATGADAQPANLQRLSSAAQVGFFGNIVAQSPSVRVTDAGGKPVGARTVAFTLLSGGGTIVGATPVLDENGIATLGGWRLGPADATQQVRATIAGLPPADFTVTAAAPPASAFTVDVRFLGEPPTANQQKAFTNAAARWAQVLVGDQPDVAIHEPGDPDGCFPAIDETVDDLVIFARVTDIDGVGGILGRAGPCLARDDNLIPVVGIMEFDKADLGVLEGNGRLGDVILHEMGHVLGFGRVIWDLKGLIVGAGEADPTFTGPSARSAYYILALPNSAFSQPPVPLENTGGAGTRDSHWREAIFHTELMTGFIDVSNPLSALTVASFRDEGYVVNDAVSDPFTFLAAVRAAAEPPPLRFHLGEWTGPLRTVDRRGRVVREFLRRK